MESFDTGRFACNVRMATSCQWRVQRVRMSRRRDVERPKGRLVVVGAKGEAAISPCILEYQCGDGELGRGRSDV